NLFSGPEELVRRNMGELAAVVIFLTVVAPACRLKAMIYVLSRSREAAPPRHLRRVFAFAEQLRPWSMIEVFVFGVFVAYVKLGDLFTIGLATGVYALMGLTVVLVWIDSALDREAIWERLDPRIALTAAVDQLAHPIGCEVWGLMSTSLPEAAQCSRCGSILRFRKANSIARTWALVITAGILYGTGQYYTPLTVMQLQ